MRKLFSGTIGGRGVALLVVAAVAGALLGLHGWSGRHGRLPAGSFGTSPARTHPATPAGRHPAASPTAPPASQPAAGSPGPKLSSESYAGYSYLVWPGTPTPAARAALTGLSISVHRGAAGVQVTAGVAGGNSRTTYYPKGERVYVIEASLGDDSGNSDFNLGDDGLVVTDALGRIIR